ncbi:MAG: GGDEF domain-containing protein [Acidobacteria bacterium]|nr:GGDEF domain-containing protein [Acidobacteriota bacterium]
MESTIGLIIQFTGIFLIAVLSLFLRRSLKTAASTLWAFAWTSLSFALFCLSFAFLYEEIAKPLYCLYFLSEYIFGLMLIYGCRALSEDYKFDRRSQLLILPFAVVAFVLPFAATDFNYVFNFHALILGSFFAVAFLTLRSMKLQGFGAHVMRIALALLALDFYHYFVLFTLLEFDIKIPMSNGYLAFNPVIDFVLEVMLGFGMVIVSLENVLQEFRKVHQKLQEAHEKLEQTAHIDPLTMAFNRHAFYGYLRKRGDEQAQIAGCVGFFDIDDLKPINDQLGHAVGDMAIRAVVGAIRELMRAEDLIYRWGGDEFFVIMVSMTAEMAAERMKNIERMLTDVRIDGTEKPLTIRVSYGFKDFSDISNMEAAINTADEEMYRRKQERKLRRRLTKSAVFLSNENILVSSDRR